MFGPNNTPEYHHRGHEFHALYRLTQQLFCERFGLDNHDVLFIPGSGTAANEAVIANLRQPIRVTAPRGAFASRLCRLAMAHDKLAFGDGPAVEAAVMYETAASRLVTVSAAVLDAISGFPYYIPDAAVWTCVSGKQLGAAPGLGIVVVRRDAWHMFHESSTYSTLNLSRYKHWDTKHEMPHTPPLTVLLDLAGKLLTFDRGDLVDRIDYRRALLAEASPGMGTGPVYTFRSLPENIIKDFGIYVHGGHPQAFLWAGTDEEYAALVGAIKCVV